jgi:DNA-binding response OmpR family regulator
MNGHVLHVDDDADTRDLIKIWLGLHGYRVTAVSTVADALELVQTVKFNIYILDNWLQGADGIELCRRIRAFDRNTPILFLSGAAYQGDKDQAIGAGAQAYLTKPADLDEFYETVARLI